MSGSVDKTSELLADVSIQDLMNEVQRRIDCAKKPDKRIILIGPPGQQRTSHTTTTTTTQLNTHGLSPPRLQPSTQPVKLTESASLSVLSASAVRRLRQGHTGSASEARELLVPLGYR